MKSPGLLERLDDMLNPIVVKELRQAVQSRVVVVALLLFLLLQVGILGVFLLFSELRRHDAVNFSAGREIFLVLQGVLLGTCMLLVPTYAGVRLAAERSDTNVDLLFISTLKPRSIIVGKFLAAVVLMLLVFSACAPFMTFTYLLRGIDLPSILLVLTIDVAAVLAGTQLMLFLGAVPTNRALKVMLGLMGLGGLFCLFFAGMGTSVSLLEMGGFLWLEKRFWLVAGGLTAGEAALVGLVFTWSVAVVSPPSTNRALPVRLYTVGAWVVTGAIAALLSYQLGLPVPLYLWMGAVVGLGSLQLIISVNERDHWGPRVARAIPRRWWLRVPAFFFYSGSAGGIALGVLLVALSIGFGWWLADYWQTRFTTFRALGLSPFNDRLALGLSLIGLFTYDYCLTATWLRRLLFARHVKADYTWAVALVLAALGCTVPFLFYYMLSSEQGRTGEDLAWWLFSNPLAVIVEFFDVSPRFTGLREYDQVSLAITWGWAAVVTVFNAPWLVRQARSFRPFVGRDRPASAHAA
jgi:hypothetical protein